MQLVKFIPIVFIIFGIFPYENLVHAGTENPQNSGKPKRQTNNEHNFWFSRQKRQVLMVSRRTDGTVVLGIKKMI